MQEEFAYVEHAYCPDCSFSGPYLERRSRYQPTSLLHCPCFAGVFQSQLLKQYAVYTRDEKEQLKQTPRRNVAVINLLSVYTGQEKKKKEEKEIKKHYSKTLHLLQCNRNIHYSTYSQNVSASTF
jgi:hypothetical protein